MVWYGMIRSRIPLKKSKELQNKKVEELTKENEAKQGYILAVLKEGKIIRKFLRSSQKIS